MSGRTRAFLFLQGPPGPLFMRLGEALAAKGHAVHRINLSGGDYRDWPVGSVNFRGDLSEWPVFVDRFLGDNAITDLMLFGDCRPYHVAAHGIAALRSVRTHVLEEGYLRPNWMTLEPDGVNAHSRLSRDPRWFRQEAGRLPEEPDLPPVTASFGRRASDSYWHYHDVRVGRSFFPHYRSHRPGSIIVEGFGWLWKLANENRRRRAADRILNSLGDVPAFIFPLQLSGDYQIRSHSPFPTMQAAATYVIASFAKHAPPAAHLVVKAHPLDCSFFNWNRFVRQSAAKFKIADRVHFVDGGDLESMTATAEGLVCVNSTSATLALAHGTPVCTIGQAIYNFPGLTHQEHLDSFWSNPTPPEPGLYEAFRRVLVDRCLVRGGCASESAVTLLIQSILERFERDEAEASGNIADT